jgi:dTDP-4-dehydrorhamnose reductase
MAEEAARLDAWFVHYSTDYVFDGSGTVPWREDDSPAPLNVYGATKWRGEQAVRDTGCRHLIFRTQWVYSARSENFIRKILRLAAERDSLTVVNDQFGAPTDA